MNEGLGAFDLTGWERFWDELTASSGVRGSLGELIGALASGATGDHASLGEAILTLAAASFREGLGAYASLIAVALICSAVRALSGGKGGTAEMTGFLCLAMSAATASYNLAALFALTADAIGRLNRAMELVTPIMTAALAAVGSTMVSGAIRPLMAFLTTSVSGVFTKGILPLAMAMGVTAMAGMAAEGKKLAPLFGFLKSAIRYGTGAVFTVYFGIISIQGMTMSRADSIAIRTARYTLDKSVPIIGGAMSGTLDTVLSSAAAVKNALGGAAMATVVLAAFSPLLRIACTSLACKAIAAVCAPMGEERISAFMERTSDVCGALFAALATVAVMFMITLGLAVATGNG